MVATSGDVHDYLNSLLVTDRQALGFLHKNVIGGQDNPALEQSVVDLVKHVRDHQGAAPRNLKHWLGSLGSLERRYQTCVLQMCGYYRDASLAPQFQGVLRQLTHVALHPAAVAALAQTMGIRAGQVLTEMLWATPVNQWHLRETAILRQLGLMGWTSSIDHLLRALSVPYDHPVQVAAEALAGFPVADVQPRLLEVLTSPAEPRQRAGAAEALGLLGDPGALFALQKVGEQSGDPRLIAAAAVARARLGDPGAERVLVDLATRDQGHHLAEARIRAMSALGLLGRHRDGEALSEGALEALLRGLEDSQPEVRSEAARALGAMGHGPAARSIAQALRKEVSPLVRSALIQALGRLGSATSLPILLDFLRRDTRGVQIEILNALSQFPNPNLVEHISPFRNAADLEVREAAERALRRLLYRPFSWPLAAPLEREVAIPVYTLRDARRLLLPPPPPPPEPGFFARFFGAAPTPTKQPAPAPIGQLLLSPRGLRLALSQPTEAGWSGGELLWERRFGVHVTREPIGEEGGLAEDIGVHFTLRQREAQGGAHFETVAVSLWCAPSPAVGRFQAKSERLPCLDPHQAAPLLAALRYYLEVHGEPLPFVV